MRQPMSWFKKHFEEQGLYNLPEKLFQNKSAVLDITRMSYRAIKHNLSGYHFTCREKST